MRLPNILIYFTCLFVLSFVGEFFLFSLVSLLLRCDLCLMSVEKTIKPIKIDETF